MNELIKRINISDNETINDVIKFNVDNLLYYKNSQNVYNHLFISVLYSLSIHHKYKYETRTIINIDECVCVTNNTITLLYNSGNCIVYIEYNNHTYYIDSCDIEMSDNNLYRIIEYIIKNY